MPALFIAIFFLAGALPDYVAIAKSKFFLRKAARFRRTIWSTIVLIVLDGISSYVISVVSIILAAVGTVVGYSQLPWQHAIFYSSQGAELGETIGTFAGLFWYSTMLTSVWMLLILLSTVLLRIFSPVHRFTVWFFDVDRHPVKAIGIVSATLVLIGGLIWMGLRATI